MEAVTVTNLVIYALVSFGAAILSGIAGAGGGFIMTPVLIFLGLPPAQAVATGKLPGLAVTVGSLQSLKKVPKGSTRRLIVILLIALVIGLLAPSVIVSLDDDLYKNFLALLLLAMIPVLVFNKVGFTRRRTGRLKQLVGYVLLAVSLALQAVFSGGLGSLVNIVMMAFLGMNALEANVTKRYSQVLLNIVIVLGILSAGLIVWPFALVGMVAAGAGGLIGGKIAANKGSTFVMTVFIVLMFVSAIALLLS